MIAFRIPKIKDVPTIDYQKLAWLCTIDGLRNHENPETSPEAHELFMKNYKKIFVQPPKLIGLPVHSEKREKLKHSTDSVSHKATGPTHKVDGHIKTAVKSDLEKLESHNISDYLSVYRKTRKNEDPALIRSNFIKTLRKLLRKYPFERTPSENDKMFSILKNFPFFAHIPENVLKELCVVAQLEIWNDNNFTVFGNNALFMILKGSVQPLSHPYLNSSNLKQIDAVSPITHQRSPTPEPTSAFGNLDVGECFGTLIALEGREPTSRLFSVKTQEPNCEFLKISTSDYSRVIEQIQQREQTEKLNLVLSGEQYSMWPRQPVMQVASLIEWIEYPPNTVVASEGYKAPFIAFIKSGECHVLRQLEVMHTLPSGKKERKTKQVVMGKLKTSDSFAEISVLQDEPILCSIVTATDIELGVIKPEKIKELDDVTIQLFKQSNTKTWGNLTKEEIQDEYMQQELKREWNEFKHNIIFEVINARGIRPGYGKWAK